MKMIFLYITNERLLSILARSDTHTSQLFSCHCQVCRYNYIKHSSKSYWSTAVMNLVGTLSNKLLPTKTNLVPLNIISIQSKHINTNHFFGNAEQRRFLGKVKVYIYTTMGCHLLPKLHRCFMAAFQSSCFKPCKTECHITLICIKQC